MINETYIANNIFSNALQIDKPVLEFNDALVSPTFSIYCGNCVSLDAGGAVVPATTNVKVLGLAKVNKNAYVDETAGALGGIYGSGKMGVVVKGIVTLRHNYFQSASTGAVTEVKTFAETSYTPMAALFQNASAQLSSSGAVSSVTVGFVLAYSSTNKALQVFLDC